MKRRSDLAGVALLPPTWVAGAAVYAAIATVGLSLPMGLTGGTLPRRLASMPGPRNDAARVTPPGGMPGRHAEARE